MSGKMKSILIIAFLIPLFIMDVISYISLPSNKESEEKVRIKIRPGDALTNIADSLLHKGLIKEKKLFLFWAVSLGYEKKIKAGVFEIPLGLNYAQVAGFLAEKGPENLTVTLIEGWPNSRINAALASKLDLDKNKLDSLCADEIFLQSLNIRADNMRGWLLPDTYSLSYGMNEKQILRFLAGQTLKIFEADSAKHSMKRYGLNIQQVLTMASIIEGEAVLDEERPFISSVYHNRLKKRMRLQADPTIQFIIKDKPRRLLYKDLKIESPYNTYLHYGLPPGPINNPGKLSIMAALFPADSKFIYFVAKGDGSHVFTTNSKDHARAKAAFNRVRRQTARSRK